MLGWPRRSSEPGSRPVRLTKTPGQEEATRALRHARHARRRSQRLQPEIQQIAESLRETRIVNHFAERFRAALEGRR
jgi:hypothetical protein